MKRLALMLLALLVTVSAAFSGSGGSAYSIFGIGDLRSITGMRNAGMGNAGLGLASPASINALAPASWARINRVMLEAGVLYEGFNSTDGTRSLYRAAGTFGGALLAVPISTDYGVVFTGGFLPYSSLNYSTFTRGSQAGVEYLLNHRGQGGLGRGLAGLSYAPLPWLSLGSSLDYYFGTMDRSSAMTAATSAGAISGGTITRSITAHGVGVTASALIEHFGATGTALHPLSFGLMAGSRAVLRSTDQTKYKFATESDSTAETQGTFVLPLTLGAGAGWAIDERHTAAADIVTQLWEKTGTNDPDLRNSTRIAAGIERSATRDPLTPWADRLIYRLGFSWTATYYNPDGNPVHEWAVTAGTGIPFAGDARLDLGVEYARRSARDEGLITDSIIRVFLSLHISEAWFVRTEEE
jgi:hypothetical protein